MPELTPDINVLRSFVFVRMFTGNIIEKTDIRLQKEAGTGNIKMTAISNELTPRKIQFASRLYLIEQQKDKNPQDRLIDIFV